MNYDDVALKKMEALLDAVAQTESFEADDELTADELDSVTAGVTVPGFQKFMQYVRERDANE
jgi:hypothetical protein